MFDKPTRDDGGISVLNPRGKTTNAEQRSRSEKLPSKKFSNEKPPKKRREADGFPFGLSPIKNEKF